MKSWLLALVVIPFLCLSAQGAGTKKIAAPPPETQSLVTGVKASTHEVTIVFKNSSYTVSKNAKTYTVDGLTSVTIDGTPGKFADIRVGMIVDGATERDSHTLDNITLEGAGAAPAPAPAKKK